MKKKIFAFVCAIVCCFSIFGVFSMTNREPVAYADDASTTDSLYISSGLYFPFVFNKGVYPSSIARFDSLSYFCTSTVSPIMSVDSTSSILTIKPLIDIYWSNYYTNNLDVPFDSEDPILYSWIIANQWSLSRFNESDTDTFTFNFSDLNANGNSFKYTVYEGDVDNPTGVDKYSSIGIYIYKPSNITSFPSMSDLVYFNIGNSNDNQYGNRLSQSFLHGAFNYVRYYFSNGFSIIIAIPTMSNVSYLSNSSLANSFVLPFRTYYIASGVELSNNAIYEQAFNAGYSEGYTENLESATSEAYDYGVEVGRARGYQEGLAETKYTFNQLFGATIDAPVQVLSGLFNFELLGVNLWGLMTGLFTLAFIILVIKLVLGGK